jgi:hypothetical protein
MIRPHIRLARDLSASAPLTPNHGRPPMRCIKPGVVLQPLRISAKHFLSNSGALRNIFLFANRSFTTGGMEETGSAHQSATDSPATGTSSPQPEQTSSKKQKQQRPPQAQKQKPYVPKKEVRILMLHGIFPFCSLHRLSSCPLTSITQSRHSPQAHDQRDMR